MLPAFPKRLLVVACLAAQVAPTVPTVAARKPPQQGPPPVVVVETALGEIEIEVDPARAPVTAANFLRYVDGGFYDGGRFHRTVKMDNQPGASARIEVIQAGIDPARADD